MAGLIFLTSGGVGLRLTVEVATVEQAEYLNEGKRRKADDDDDVGRLLAASEWYLQ